MQDKQAGRADAQGPVGIDIRQAVSDLVEAGIHAQGPEGLMVRSEVATAALRELYRLADLGQKAEQAAKAKARAQQQALAAASAAPEASSDAGDTQAKAVQP